MKLPPVKSHTFRGRRWTVGRSEHRDPDERGVCEAPWTDHKVIDVPVHGGTVGELDTLLHESLHACMWDMDEEAIHESARDIARFLWRLGWRKGIEVRDGR